MLNKSNQEKKEEASIHIWHNANRFDENQSCARMPLFGLFLNSSDGLYHGTENQNETDEVEMSSKPSGENGE